MYRARYIAYLIYKRKRKVVALSFTFLFFFADLFAKDLLEGVTTFPRIDNAQSCSFLELSCLYLKRILEMKHRRVQTLFVEGKPEPALASALLQARAMGLNVVIKLKTTESNSETQEEFKELGLDDVVIA